MKSIDKISIEGENLLRYLPHRAPIIMIDRLLSFTNKEANTELEIRADNIFVQSSRFSSSGIIEHVAQSAAVFGSIPFVDKGECAPIGFIGAVKNLDIIALPKVGEILNTKVEVLHEVFSATVVKGEVTMNGKLLAQMELKIFLDEN